MFNFYNGNTSDITIDQLKDFGEYLKSMNAVGLRRLQTSMSLKRVSIS